MLVLTTALSVRSQDTTYIWNGGASGYSGTIVLDSPFSADGSVADIVSIRFSTPDFQSLTVQNPALVDRPLTWNPTQITGMILYANTSNPFDLLYITENAGLEGNILSARSILYDTLDSDTSGSWVAASPPAVPDGGSTVWLLGLSILALGVSAIKICSGVSGGWHERR